MKIGTILRAINRHAAIPRTLVAKALLNHRPPGRFLEEPARGHDHRAGRFVCGDAGAGEGIAAKPRKTKKPASLQ